MSMKITCVCNVCGAQKKEANHWILAVRFMRHESVDHVFLGFGNWDDRVAEFPGVMHLCGNACLQAKLADHLGGTEKS